MVKIVKGLLNAKGKSFGIVVSRFNELISSQLLQGALDCLVRHGAEENKITVVWVPGAFEIPAVLAKLAKSKKYDALIGLGAVVKGDTPHWDYIASQVTRGIAQLSTEFSLPVILGVLTPENLEQALERAGTKSGNKGWDAAISAIEMVNLWPEI